MKRWGKTSAGLPQWRIGTEDLSDVLFPPNDRMLALFKKHVNGREITILVRQSNSMVVEAPPGLTQSECEPFLHALWEETHFK